VTRTRGIAGALAKESGATNPFKRKTTEFLPSLGEKLGGLANTVKQGNKCGKKQSNAATRKRKQLSKEQVLKLGGRQRGGRRIDGQSAGNGLVYL